MVSPKLILKCVARHGDNESDGLFTTVPVHYSSLSLTNVSVQKLARPGYYNKLAQQMKIDAARISSGRKQISDRR